jgi:hypothetical protein
MCTIYQAHTHTFLALSRESINKLNLLDSIYLSEPFVIEIVDNLKDLNTTKSMPLS